ncbi:MAG: zincin-like metallopeptidase domain-containing protein [Cyanobacteriota bacterium]|jgi:antirestriction protein ArdC|nr:zincin-like metallopeptidase domain-containing protein [Cyanobacteriota bacterium]
MAHPPVDDMLVASLIALMEQGTAPWRREWDSRSGGHHVNLLSGRAYRGANPILLTIGLHQRGATLPYWCGAGEAKSHGLFPKTGSKVVTVLRPQVRRKAKPESEDSTRNTCWVRYVPVSLFNVQDLEGDALPALIHSRQAETGEASRPEPERLAQAEAVLRQWPVPIQHGGPMAFYNPQADRIHLPERQAFRSSAALYATWAHEALHSTGHPSRLARNLHGCVGSAAYAREELVAELGAVLLGDRLEIGSNVANHAAYLSAWIGLLKESPKLLYRLLSEARKAADLICPNASSTTA